MPVTREEVIWAYRCILGREPESEDAIKGALFHPDLPSLRRAMMDSVEFLTALVSVGPVLSAAPQGRPWYRR
jgi:hypothetical protein